MKKIRSYSSSRLLFTVISTFTAIFVIILTIIILSGGIFKGAQNKTILNKGDNSQTQPSMEKLLLLAKEPLGRTMYIWGGGWNEEDTGAGIEAVTLGISPVWEEFARKQDEKYDYNNTRYQIHNGLDCSGYMGWLVYNLLEKENGKEGYVVSASKMAKYLSDKGLGAYTKDSEVKDWQPGDIMSMEGHVWMSLGSCEDGSVVVLHASPPGVTLSGTLLPDGSESMAVELAKKYMRTYYPKWYEKYSVKACEYRYLTDSDCMRWSKEVLADAQKIREKDAQEILRWMFGEI